MTRKVDEYRELLDPFLVSTVPAPNGDFEAFCPAHENPGSSKKPSARINFTPANKTAYPNGLIWCAVCGFEGKTAKLDNAVSIYRERAASGIKFDAVPSRSRTYIPKAGKRYKLPSVATRREFTLALLENKERLAYVKGVRGLTTSTIKKFQIGWVASRSAYCYPVRNNDGRVFAMRLYRPEDPKRKHSWYNSEEDHPPQLHGTRGLEDEPVVILTEGEFDMYLARQDGFHAVSHNGGAGKFPSSWAPWFKDKVVYVAYDADSSGKKGRELVARVLKDSARAVYFVDIPGPGGTDYTDFRIRDGHDSSEFQELLNAALEHGPAVESVETDTGLPLAGKPVSIAESIGSPYIGIPLQMTVQVLGRLDPPYVVPARVQLGCSQDKGEKFCDPCPMNTGHMTLEIDKNSDFVQRVVGARDAEVDKLIMVEAGLNCRDRVTELERLDSWSVEQIVVGESVERQDDSQESHMLMKSDTNLTMLSVDTSDSKVNEIYRVVGHQKPSPRDQRLNFTAWHREETKTNIDQFEMTEDTREMLTVFQPRGSQSVFTKMRKIAEDLTVNVAGVVDRVNLGIAYDVAWHSALAFNFGGKLDDRGWVELLVFGDTRTGKSETAHRLAAWYRNGKIFSSEGATRAGLVGGATQPNGSKHWIATWGAIPQNDRRLIVLDEAQSLVDIVKDMGSIRSKGVAEMVKVGINQSTLARTRLIWICNPLTQGKLEEFSDGAMTALNEFMPASEDRARFDLAVACSSRDVPDEDIHEGIRQNKKTPEYSSEACEKLILWAWSRTPDDIVIPKSVESYVLDKSKEIVARYEKGNFELVQGSNMHVKLARITVACAARVFSTDDTGEKLLVMKKHVDAAVTIITDAYENDGLGIGRASRRANKISALAVANLDEALAWVTTGKGGKNLTQYGHEVARVLKRNRGRFTMRDLETVGGLDGRDAADCVALMVDMGLVRQDSVTSHMIVSSELLDQLREDEI